MQHLLSLPTNPLSVMALRESPTAFVDKTAIVYQLATGRQKCFLSRPPRFGKTCLVSILEALFKHGLRDFQGLAIEKLWKEKTYNTIRLDFARVTDFGTVDLFRQQFYTLLSGALAEMGFEWDGQALSFVYQLAKWFRMQPDTSLVILIDNYDAPLIKAQPHEALLIGVQKVIGEFFSLLKSEDACCRFLFITGVRRLNFSTLFAGINQLSDITFDPTYSTLLGFTEDELMAYFGASLNAAAARLGVSLQALIEQMRVHCGGYTFDQAAKTQVYCPWLVIRFLECQTFERIVDEYLPASDKAVIKRAMALSMLEKLMAFEDTVPMSSRKLMGGAMPKPDDIKTWLWQTGCLTIRSVNLAGNFLLGYPNRTVEAIVGQLYAGNSLWASCDGYLS